MSSARLERDAHGRLVAVVVTADTVAAGTVLRVLGSEVGSGPDGAWAFTGTRTGRPNTVTAPRHTNRDLLPVERAP